MGVFFCFCSVLVLTDNTLGDFCKAVGGGWGLMSTCLRGQWSNLLKTDEKVWRTCCKNTIMSITASVRCCSCQQQVKQQPDRMYQNATISMSYFSFLAWHDVPRPNRIQYSTI